MAVLSFKRLKAKLGDNWHGGLLLVDELDAALHPLAQNKLVDFLYHQAEEIGLQIIFTTHSLGLLDYITTKTDHNSPININNYELVSVSNANGPVEVIQNPPFDIIYKELMATYYLPTSRKISIFSEDNEARYFIKKILEKYSNRFKLLDVSFGYDQLLKMLANDFNNFSQYLYILDGDVPEADITHCIKKVSPAQIHCILKLPGSKRPEEVIWQYLNQLPPDHKFLKGIGQQMSYTIRSINELGPFCSKYGSIEAERLKFKNWFNDNTQLMDDVFDYWCEENGQIIEQFVADFITAFNIIARKCFIPIIPFEPKKESADCLSPHLL
jgi:hypothetical protein